MTLACARCPVRDRAACAALSTAERDDLARAGRTRRLSRGETLFAAGAPDPACATLISGALKVTQTRADGSERILALIHPAGFVGELFQPFTHYDVVALGPAELCVFSGSQFEYALARFPALTAALLRRTQEDLYASRALLSLAGNGSAAARIAGAIMSLARAASDSPCHPARALDLVLTRGELATMLGLTIETVSRTIGRFERDRLIRRTGRRGIELLDPARLSGLAEAITA